MSVGHIARALEEAKIATIIIAVKAFETRMRMMSLPRVLLTPQLLGRPLGNPFDAKLQISILNAALQLLEKADRNKTILDYTEIAALKDPNVSFPYQRMVNLKDQGLFAELTSNAFSFVGACSQKRLLKKTLPDWINKFVDLGIDAVVLVPV